MGQGRQILDVLLLNFKSLCLNLLRLRLNYIGSVPCKACKSGHQNTGQSGGNSGAQASTAVIRSLSLGDIETGDALKVIWKEWKVAFICGLTLAAVNFLKMLLLDGMLLRNDSVTVAVAATVSIAILFIVMFAKVVGSVLPIAAEKVGVDPAVMANPLISTLTDAVSLLIYIYAAKLILHI